MAGAQPNLRRPRHSPVPKTVAASLTVLLVAFACSGTPGTSTPAGVSGNLSEDSIEEQRRLASRGRSQFLHCNSCHVVNKDDPPPFGDDLGPHLEGLIGRRAGSVEGFKYTEALLALDLVWDEETLDLWLQAPHAMVPDMCEPFAGIANPQHRKALIAYLNSPTR